MISDGAELRKRLLEQGLDAGEIVFKYYWPRYAPPPGSGIRSLVKSEHLRPQFERLVEMQSVVQSHVPMPLATVRNSDGEFVGYVLEYVDGVTLRELIEDGMTAEAQRRLDQVRAAVKKLHARSLAHGDLNASNVLAADDGRTLLIDPVPFQRAETRLQDELCLREIRRQIDAAGPVARVDPAD